jgi:hypothetical protein
MIENANKFNIEGLFLSNLALRQAQHEVGGVGASQGL